DIGGFCRSTNSELLVRWMQTATLTPFCRNHNDAGNVDQYPWSFGAKAEKACKAAIEFRYKLMPYIYSAFVESSETGLPIMRPLVLEDVSLSHVEDQYLFGHSLLVAPIMAPGVTSRSVVLPKGDWIDWATGAVCNGTVWAQAPLDRIPVFARAGAVIPMWPEAPPSTMGYHPEAIDLNIMVPTEDGEYVSTLVEDDGETFGYEKGERLTTTLTLTKKGKNLQLVGTTSGKIFKGFARKAFRIVIGGKVVATVPAGENGFSWTG
ncbi:MAG TPA: TIM-barrel domain-containing protein, partial [Fimbriimonas sp.]|nr:TIM-barrel domain-containing protein [Fimbriimonas sp.]